MNVGESKVVTKGIIIRLLAGTAITGGFVSNAAAQTTSTVSAEPQQQGASSAAADANRAAAIAADGDIIVTARKRDETSLTVPVVVTAVGSAELNRRAINNLDGIARIVPQLIIGPQGGSVQGGNIAIRGISGPDSNPFGDQAVSFNIDGVQVAKASVRRMSDMDIAQVEVLKGPQALFFGKNSPAGIVSIRTADPTPALEAKLSGGYEFYGREKRLEGYVSGPLSDTLGVRLAGYASDINGYIKNQVPDDAYLKGSTYDRGPRSRDYAGRLTLKWEPDDSFSARFKLNYARTRADGPANTVEYLDCPFGSPQSGSINDCKPNGKAMNAGSGPVVGTINPIFGDGHNFLRQNQVLGGLELNYKLSDNLQLTSVSGLYYVKLLIAQNYENDYSIALPSTNNLKNREFSQEIRLQSSYDGPLNFTAGVYFSDTKATTGSNTFVFAAEPSGLIALAANGLGFIPLRTPFQINNYQLRQDGQAYSAFLQMAFKPVEEVEIDVGGRYSHEKKKIPYLYDGGVGANPFGTNPLTAADLVVINPRKDHWNDFSPEVTVSYRPSQLLTLFGSYKHGFLSGGFNSGSTDFRTAGDISYDPQTIKGFEAGFKALLADGRLRLNAAAYTYKVADLQVTNYTNATNTIRNAGAVKIQGAEVDFTYRTPLEGLTINGAASYNKGKYTSFPGAPCYNGQTPAEGCNIVGGNPVQDLSGTELIRAPKWGLSGGISYEAAVSDSYKMGASVNGTYSSSFLTDATSAPQSRMPKYGLIDGTLRFGAADDGWELALIGRNLTDKRYWVASPNVPFTGGGTGTAAGVLGDRYAAMSRGREIMIRATVKFGQ
ncbi:MAG: TonB-dependent receptor [Sphingomonadales bacterium]|nr:MAG: TonB-dependent receptor [Sphingomonadales bacterium]